MKRPIFIFSGAPGSGKSTVAKALLQRYSFGYHIPVDVIREWVVSGRSDPIGSWTPETDRQFRMARETAAHTAKQYAAAGFAVAIDDVIFPNQVAAHYDDVLAAFEVFKVLLRPDVAVALARNANREHTDFDTAVLDEIIEPIYEAFDTEAMLDEGWFVINSSHLSVAETVEEILRVTGCFAR